MAADRKQKTRDAWMETRAKHRKDYAAPANETF